MAGGEGAKERRRLKPLKGPENDANPSGVKEKSTDRRIGSENQFRTKRSPAKKNRLLMIAFCFVAIYRSWSTAIQEADNQKTQTANNRESDPTSKSVQCSQETKAIIESQLDPSSCIESKKEPWLQKCSFSQATKCPDATWIDKHYKESALTSLDGSSIKESFVGISIGCNKGFDALNTMRMGTLNTKFDKDAWARAMGETDLSVCSQNIVPQFDIATGAQARQGEMHCIELMPLTVSRLTEAAQALDIVDQGFVITGAGMGKKDSTMRILKIDKIGEENLGLESVCNEKQTIGCDEVSVLSLDSFVAKYVKSTGPIHSLSIDVEGFDFDVILGGKQTLKRVQYLEFEYNWMGSWKKQTLSDAIDLLDEDGFTCYWAGQDMLWRITDCWFDHYKLHFWSNIACVNRKQEKLAKLMEATFQATLQRKDVHFNTDDLRRELYNYETRRKRRKRRGQQPRTRKKAQMEKERLEKMEDELYAEEVAKKSAHMEMTARLKAEQENGSRMQKQRGRELEEKMKEKQQQAELEQEAKQKARHEAEAAKAEEQARLTTIPEISSDESD
jgi:FkbM family methyltransferase